MARLTSLLLVVVVALGLALAVAPRDATAEDELGETVTTVLHPGLNLVGWTQPEASIDAIFKAVPQLGIVHAWDNEEQRFRWAARDPTGVVGDLETLSPGMGLSLQIGGETPISWTREWILHSALTPLGEGWNLVAWTGREGALGELANILYETWPGGTETVPQRGDALWLRVSRDKQWWQLHEPPRVEFFGEFPDSRKAELLETIDNVLAFFVRHYDVAVPGLTVRFGDAASDIPCGGYATKILFLRDSCLSAAAHEYSHAVQEYLATLRADGSWGIITSRIGPSWLSEGVANYAAALYNDLTGLHSLDEYLSDIRTAVVNPNDLSILEQDMRIGDVHTNYRLASLAVDWLINQTSPHALYDFYRNRTSTPSWEDSVPEAFGMTISELYILFAEYREELSRDHPRIDGTVLGPDGLGVEGVRLEALPQESGSSWRMETDTAGVFSGLALDGVYRLSLFASGSSCHLGWYGGQTGYTTDRQELMPLSFPDSASTGLVIQLPAPLSELCKRIQGTATDENGAPFARLWVTATPRHDQDGYSGQGANEDGSFELAVRSGGTYEVHVYSQVTRECTVSGLGGSAEVTVSGDIGGIHLVATRIPASPAEWTACTGAE